MANEISGIKLALVAPVSAAKDFSQLIRSDGVSDIAENGKALPVDGRALPQQGDKISQQSDDNALSQPPADKENVMQAVEQINEYVQTVQRNLSFSVDDDSGKTVIKVLDTDSGELIRQIPTEQVLALAAHFQDLRQDTIVPDDVNQGLLFSDIT